MGKFEDDVLRKGIAEDVRRSDAVADRIERKRELGDLTGFSEDILDEKRGEIDGLRAAQEYLKMVEETEKEIAIAVHESKDLKWALVACRIVKAEAMAEVERWTKIEEIAHDNIGPGHIHYTKYDVDNRTMSSYRRCVKRAEKTKKSSVSTAYKNEVSDRKKIRTISDSYYMKELISIIRETIYHPEWAADRIRSYCKDNKAPVTID